MEAFLSDSHTRISYSSHRPIYLVVLTLLALSTVHSNLCDYPTTGGIAISTDSYTYGDFQISINPTMVDGMLTVYGLANDGVNNANNRAYIQIVFDSGMYNTSTFEV